MEEIHMKLIPMAVTNKFGRQLLQFRKHSPQIAFAGGVTAGLASTILACRATLKLSDTLDDAADLKAKAEALHAEGTNDDYDEKQYAKDLTVIKVKTILNVTKLYAPAAGLAMISVALLTGSHMTMNRRNASLTAAYASVDQAFEKYRQRVVQQLGNDADRDFRYGTEIVSVTEEGEDGKKKTVKHTRVDSSEMPSKYARFFDELCNDWKSNPEYNRAFLHCQQTYANDMLRARGHVFLNEVYDALGIPRTKEGAVVGWVLDGSGDGYVDFGIFDDLTNPQVRDFVNGREYSILLDFNVNGLIYDKI
jgi:Family of unknown function (DUF6353)